MKIVNFNGLTRDVTEEDGFAMIFSNNDRQTEDNIRMSLREVQLMSSLIHPYIVRFKEAFIDEELQRLCVV